jgi:hypothetical protein
MLCGVTLVRGESVSDMIVAPMRQQKFAIALANASKVLRQIGEMMGDEMDHRGFALNFSANCYHACREYNASLSFEQRGPDH